MGRLFKSSETPSLFQIHAEGMKDYSEGKEIWECPYVLGSSGINDLTAWLAGWMLAKQIDKNKRYDRQDSR